MLPANEAYRDPVRLDLDRAVLIEVLGIEDKLIENLSVLRRQWCEEPSAHGGKASQRKTVESGSETIPSRGVRRSTSY